MTATPVNSNPYVIDFLKGVAPPARFTGQNQAKNSYNLSSSTDPAESDQKNSIVSEQLNDSSFLQAYNLRLQQEVPVYRSDSPTKTFNDTKKTSNIEIRDSETGEPVEFSEVEEIASEGQPGTGYYLNAGQLKKKNNHKQLDRAGAYRYNKIVKTYNLSQRQMSGTLVNLVY
jgi:hypothetical protein